MADVPFSNYLEVGDIHKGKPCIVMGNSPSINQEELYLLDDCLTIGVNRILRSYVPNYLLFCDGAIVTHEQDSIREYAGGKLVYYPLVDKHPWLNTLDGNLGWQLNPQSTGKEPSLDFCSGPNKQGYVQGEGSTPAYALQIAYRWGCNPIGVIGVDFNAPILGRQGASTHFYGDGRPVTSTGGKFFSGPEELDPNSEIPENKQGRHQKWYTGIRKALNSKGVETVNLSNNPDAPFHKAGWTKMSILDFHEKYCRSE